MKSLILSLRPWALAMAIITGASSCQEDSVAPETLQPLAVSIQPTVNGNAITTSSTVNLGSSQARARFELLQVYLSDIKLTRTPGDTVRMPNRYVLAKYQVDGTTSYALDSVLTGIYSAITFTVGIPVAANTQSGSNPANPNNFATGHPLNQAIAPVAGAEAMYWSWNSGYIFHRMEGYVDTSSDNTGGALTVENAAVTGSKVVPLIYHIGLNGFQRTITLPLSLTVGNGGAVVPLEVDYGQVFQNLDVKLNVESHSFGSTVTAPATLTGTQMAEQAATGTATAFSVAN